MSTLGERIKAARKKCRMTQRDVAAAIGVNSGNVIGNWERDDAEPSVAMLVKLSKTLDVDLAYLLDYYGGDEITITPYDIELAKIVHQMDDGGRSWILQVATHELGRSRNQRRRYNYRKNVRPIRFFPLPVSAGTGIDLDADNTEETIDILLTDESKIADFVLRVQGDSMEPDFENGDLVLVRQTPEVEVGQLGIFNRDGEAFFKKRGEKQLISLNPKYPPIDLVEPNNVTVFGRVIGKAQLPKTTQGRDERPQDAN